jgi:anti-sigma28 factor (negative regulator of flagellin synthesis)
MSLPEEPRDDPGDTPTGASLQRIETLKQLVRHSAYEVPADEVAARIIRYAFGLPMPIASGRN